MTDTILVLILELGLPKKLVYVNVFEIKLVCNLPVQRETFSVEKRHFLRLLKLFKKCRAAILYATFLK